MAKPVDLSPKLSSLRSAELELQLDPGVQEMAERRGGLSLYSSSFRRGYGDKVFGSDENGIWLGKADFDGAPFSVDMEGNVIALSAIFGQYISKTEDDQDLTGSVNVGAGNVKIDGPNKRILINDNTNDRVLVGKF